MLYVSLRNISCLVNKMTFKISLIKTIILLLLFTNLVLELKTESCAYVSCSMLPLLWFSRYEQGTGSGHRICSTALCLALMTSQFFYSYHGYLFVLLLVYRSFFNLQFDIPNESIKAFVKHHKVSVCNLKLNFV